MYDVTSDAKKSFLQAREGWNECSGSCMLQLNMATRQKEANVAVEEIIHESKEKMEVDEEEPIQNK